MPEDKRAPFSLGRRVEAARVLAGHKRREDLADKLDRPGLGAATLGAIERDTRKLAPHERRYIAEACSLPPAFFTLDFATLGTPDAPPTTIHALERRVEQLEQLVADAQAETATRFRELAESTGGHTAAPVGAAPETHRASNG